MERLQQDPATMLTIVESIAEGGTLLELARQWDVPYHELATWIAAEKDRQDRYNLALDFRKEYLAELVIAGIRTIADVDIGDAYDQQGNLKAMHDIPEHIRRAIAGVEVFEEFEGRGEARTKIGETKKLKLIAKDKALELLGKYRKMFVDRVEHEGKVTLEELVGGSMATPEKARP